MPIEIPETPVLRTAGDAAALFRPHFVGCTRERLLVAHLGRNKRLLGLVPGDDGARHHVRLPLRAIVADAIGLGSAVLVIAHCHPSGDLMPSETDIVVTRKLRELFALLDIALYDHLIFAGGACRSLRALGLL